MSKNESEFSKTDSKSSLPSRREALYTGGVATGALLLSGPGCGGDASGEGMCMGMASPMAIVASDGSDIPVGRAKQYKYNDLAIFLAQYANGFMAINSTCKHMGCGTLYNPTSNLYECGCHGSKYKTDGSVSNGPTTMPLDHVPLCRRADGALIIEPLLKLSTNSSRVK